MADIGRSEWRMVARAIISKRTKKDKGPKLTQLPCLDQLGDVDPMSSAPECNSAHQLSRGRDARRRTTTSIPQTCRERRSNDSEGTLTVAPTHEEFVSAPDQIRPMRCARVVVVSAYTQTDDGRLGIQVQVGVRPAQPCHTLSCRQLSRLAGTWHVCATDVFADASVTYLAALVSRGTDLTGVACSVATALGMKKTATLRDGDAILLRDDDAPILRPPVRREAPHDCFYVPFFDTMYCSDALRHHEEACFDGHDDTTTTTSHGDVPLVRRLRAALVRNTEHM